MLNQVKFLKQDNMKFSSNWLFPNWSKLCVSCLLWEKNACVKAQIYTFWARRRL